MNKPTILVTVSGPVGCGKSAVAGEIEIMCKALGLHVEWPGGSDEKRLTHADWTEALELYQPIVRIEEKNDVVAAPTTPNNTTAFPGTSKKNTP